MAVASWPHRRTPEVPIPAALATVPAVTLVDRQVDTLLALGYPALAGLTDAQLTARLAPLRDAADASPTCPPTTRRAGPRSSSS